MVKCWECEFLIFVCNADGEAMVLKMPTDE